jgi:predicted XRE-type DNA-binding protein
LISTLCPYAQRNLQSVWDALCDTRAAAADIGLRSALLSAIIEYVESWDALRLDELMRGKINKFSLDALVSVATAAGFKLRFQFEEAAS